jgi:hypothetical protein
MHFVEFDPLELARFRMTYMIVAGAKAAGTGIILGKLPF